MRVETETKKVPITTPDVAIIHGRLRKFVLRPMLCAICASVGIFGGLASIFVGLVCVLIHAAIADDLAFDRVGSVLLIIAIPMILIGSIFLDEINSNKC